MDERKFRFHNGKYGAALAVRVVPRAKKDEIIGVLADGSLRIRLKAPPVEGKAFAVALEEGRGLMRFGRRQLLVDAHDHGRIGDDDATPVHDVGQLVEGPQVVLAGSLVDDLLL